VLRLCMHGDVLNVEDRTGTFRFRRNVDGSVDFSCSSDMPHGGGYLRLTADQFIAFLELLLPDVAQAMNALEKREVITRKPEDRAMCCGSPRDEDGFCQHRLGHAVFVPWRTL
jgi:hypothetical protein